MPDVHLNHVYELYALLGALQVTDCSFLCGKLNLMGIWLCFISVSHWKLWNGPSVTAELESSVWVLLARLENIYFPLKMFDLKIQLRGRQPDNLYLSAGTLNCFYSLQSVPWSCGSLVLSFCSGIRCSKPSLDASTVPSGTVCLWLLLEEVTGHFHCFFWLELSAIIPANSFLDLKIKWRFL